MTDDRAQRSAATKVLDVLSTLTRGPGPHRIVDVAADTELAKATVYRMLQSLVSAGFVVGAPGGTYVIGPRFLGIAAAAIAEDPHRPIIRTALERLRKATGLSAHHVQRFEDQVVVVDSLESSDPYGLPSRPGDTASIGSTAFGIAIADARPGTPPTVTVLDEPRVSGVRSLAAPVFDGDEQVVGSIGVSGTTFTLTGAAVERLSALVADIAANTTAVLSARSAAGPRRRRA
jgi:DNA-binding IclR family transcriptional regulator